MSRCPIRPVGQFSTDRQSLLIFMEPFLQEGNELFLVQNYYKLGNLNFDCRGALGTKGVKIDSFNFRNVAFLRKTLQKGSNQSNRTMFRRKLKQLENVDLAKLLINNSFQCMVIWVKQCLKKIIVKNILA